MRSAFVARFVRAALLAGVSAAALSFGLAGPANAQSTYIDVLAQDAPAGTGVYTTSSPLALDAPQYEAGTFNGFLYANNNSNNTSTVIAGGTISSMACVQCANFSGNSTEITPTSVTVSDGVGNSVQTSPTRVLVQDAAGNSAQLSTTGIGIISASGTAAGINTVGIGTFAGPGLTNQTFGVDAATGNLFTTGSITSTDTLGGSTTVNGGTVGIVGGTNTNQGNHFTLSPTNAALGVQGGAWIQNGLGVSGGILTDTITSVGTSPVLGATSINGGSVLISGGNGTNYGGNVSTLNIGNASLSANGGAWIQAGLGVEGGLGVTGGTTTDTLSVTGTGATAGTTLINGGQIVSANTYGGISNINGGSIQILGGTNTNQGNFSTLSAANAALGVQGGAWVLNGLGVQGGTITDTLSVTGTGASAGSNTSINGGTVTIFGGNNTNQAGNVSTLSAGNASLYTNAGAWVQAGLGVQGGLSVTGGTTTDSLTVTGFSATGPGIVVSNANGALTTESVSSLLGSAAPSLNNGTTIGTGSHALSINSAGQLTNGLSVSNGAVQIGSSTTGVTLNTDGTATFNTSVYVPAAPGGTPATGGTTINNAGITVGDSQTQIDAVSGTVTVNATGPANKQTVLNATNGNVSVGGDFVINNPGSTVDMGGNRVQDVAAPILPTDAANKAYVDAGLAAANQRIDKANQGIAIAMAVQNPVLTGADRFGITANWGDFAGNNAVGAAAVGIVGQNIFGAGEKVGLTGGFGVSSNQVAGRVGMQLTW